MVGGAAKAMPAIKPAASTISELRTQNLMGGAAAKAIPKAQIPQATFGNVATRARKYSDY